jgi:hypothetical protein
MSDDAGAVEITNAMTGKWLRSTPDWIETDEEGQPRGVVAQPGQRRSRRRSRPMRKSRRSRRGGPVPR